MSHSRFLVLSASLLTLGLSGAADPADPSPEARLVRVGDIGTARAAHTTTALRSGQLLIAGGMGSGESGLSSAELIDPATMRVTAAGSMAEARAGHTATLLPDGRVVVAGGYNGSYLESIEVFDPATRRFSPLGRLNEGRSGQTATLLPDGRILFTGGVGTGWTFLASAEVFDPATARSSTVGPLGQARESHTATLLANGKVLIVGGHRGRRAAMEVYRSAELYDPSTQRFEPTGGLETARHKHDAVLLGDGRVLVLGGADRTDRNFFGTTEIYDPGSGSFATGPAMASTRYKFQGTSVGLASGEVLVAGGARVPELLDRQATRFRPVTGEFPEAYFYATATELPSGDVFIVGGYDRRNQSTAGVWRFRAR
jgi:hypothetical protein